MATIKRVTLALSQLLVATSPVVAELSGKASVVWPPLGTISDYVAPVATAVIAIFALAPYVLVEKKTAKRWFISSLTTAFFCLIVYAFLVGKYVVEVPTPRDGNQTRSVGFIVQQIPKQLYPDASFSKLLLHGGLDEDRIELTWTPNSVLAARVCLLAFLAFTLSAVNVALGSAAYITKRTTSKPILPVRAGQS